MSCCSTNSDTQDSCDCGTGQTRSDIACPLCRRPGATVGIITPQNTLKRQVRDRLDSDTAYHFCESPECDVVYYNDHDTSVFHTADLVHRVTIKDDAPDTRLCYCFKVLKQQALDEIAQTGTTNVFETIQSRMKPGQSCFCEKANPRGDTCVKDIRTWLEQQGVVTGHSEPDPISIGETASNGCCAPASVPKAPAGGCCDGASAEQAPKEQAPKDRCC